MAAVALMFFAPVAVLAAVVLTTRAPLLPHVRTIALGTVATCLAAAILRTLG